jgi:hypothetical protein
MKVYRGEETGRGVTHGGTKEVHAINIQIYVAVCPIRQASFLHILFSTLFNPLNSTNNYAFLTTNK